MCVGRLPSKANDDHRHRLPSLKHRVDECHVSCRLEFFTTLMLWVLPLLTATDATAQLPPPLGVESLRF